MTRELGELENAVMTAVWGTSTPMNVRETMDALQTEGRALAYTTVSTVMVNLHAKGWLHRALDGRAFRYTGVCTRAEYAAGLAQGALEHSDDATASFVALVSGLSQGQRSALETALRITGESQGEAGSARAGGVEQ
ncbi:BlaI/MecI/CopY family transcriptional regulator [Streptomyces sp. NPDC002659]|uniref:BlaI/MecI/CopY family transcriptional regulator n=1 Tax=Streptomyces sp. NPDC002659 TaxID=3364656 RepID=UPI003679DE3B